jgi:DNA-binding IclR family transcriptional regulator
MLLTIDTAGHLLDLFTPQRPERGVTEVAAELGVSKSKAHALLASLAHVGLLRRTDGGRYRLGWRVLSLSRVLDDTTEFRGVARPIMAALSQRFHETVHLGVLDGGRVVYVDRVEDARSPRLTVSRVGAVLPAHCSAVGKILLAQLSVAELDEVVARHGLAPRTPSTLASRRELDLQLERVRRTGWAIERGEAVAGVSCVAAPIVGQGPRVLAAMSLTAPSERFAEREDVYVRAVVVATEHVRRRLRAAAVAPDAMSVHEYARAA